MQKRLLFIFTCIAVPCFVYAQDISLNSGWHLKGTQSKHENMSAFNTTCLQHAWKYNSTSSSWMLYSPNPDTLNAWMTKDSSISALTSVDENDGFWLDLNETCTLDIDETNTSQTIQLSIGWQLKGTQVTYDSMSLVHNSCIDIVWTYDNENSTWSLYSPDINILSTIDANYAYPHLNILPQGSGFWIKANDTCTLNSDYISAVDGNFSTMYKKSTQSVDDIWDLDLKIDPQNTSSFKVAIRMVKENGTYGEIVLHNLSITSGIINTPDRITIYGKRVNEIGTGTFFDSTYDPKGVRAMAISLHEDILSVKLGSIIESQTLVDVSSFTNPNLYKVQILLDNINLINSKALQTEDFASGYYPITSSINQGIEGNLHIQ